MLAYTAESLIKIFEAYHAATGIPAVRLGLIVAGNEKLFSGLLRGADCTTASALRASDWFDLNWPPHVAWPVEVWRRPVWMLYADTERGPTTHAKAALRRRANAVRDNPQTDPPAAKKPRQRRATGSQRDLKLAG